MGPTTSLLAPGAITLDGEQLFVADGARILVFARDATGDTAPTRTLQALAAPSGVEIAHDMLLVSDGARVLEFAPTATGDTAPMHAITGQNTGLDVTRSLRACD